MSDNKRETGPRVRHERDDEPATDQNASMPSKPKPHGLSQDSDETQAKLRQSDGVNPARGPAQQKIPATRPERDDDP